MSAPMPNQATIEFAKANEALLSPNSSVADTTHITIPDNQASELTTLNGTSDAATDNKLGLDPAGLDGEAKLLQRSYTTAKRHGEVLPPLGTQLKNIILGSWLNLLLVFIPLGILAETLHWGDTAIFFLNFLAVIPLAKLLGLATEELALRTGQTIGGLLNATFGNAVELIIGIISLKDGLINVVQASILGSILGNLLLILGLCFLCGGIKYPEQRFNATAAGIAASLMNISIVTLVMISAFFYQLNIMSDADVTNKVLELSRGSAIILLVMYGLYLFFQLKTHKHLYQEDLGITDLAEHSEEPAISVWLAAGLLVVATVFVAVAAEFLVGAIEGVSHQLGLSTTFVGFILLPLVGNAAEHLTAVTVGTSPRQRSSITNQVAMKNKMELALGVALGSSIQIALLIGPLLVLIGWIIGQPMTLEFGLFETVCAFVSALVVSGLIQDGRSNWLEGALLLCLYLIIAVAHFFLPDTGGSSNHTP